MVAQRKRRRRWIKRSSTGDVGSEFIGATIPQNAIHMYAHNKRLRFVILQCVWIHGLCKCGGQEKKKQQKTPRNKSRKKPPYNNHGTIMALCKCFDGFMYSNSLCFPFSFASVILCVYFFCSFAACFCCCFCWLFAGDIYVCVCAITTQSWNWHIKTHWEQRQADAHSNDDQMDFEGNAMRHDVMLCYFVCWDKWS